MPTPKKGYFIDGERVPSVTTVLGITAFTSGDALCGWAAKLAREGKDWKKERARAGYVGSTVHDAIESYPTPPTREVKLDDRERAKVERETGRPAELTDEEWARVVGAFEAHGEWVSRRRPKVLLQELQLVSRRLRCGGTPDLVVRIGETPYLTDHKTGKSIGAKELAQVGAYADMVKEVCGVEVAGAIIFHHPPPDSPAGRLYIAESGRPFRAHPIAPEVLATGLKAFEHARELYDLAGELKGIGVEALR